MARIDKTDFTLYQIFTDDTSVKELDINYGSNFIFAYQIPEEVLNRDAIPALTEEELLQAQPEIASNSKLIDVNEDDNEVDRKDFNPFSADT
jgi:hypothetical protein